MDNLRYKARLVAMGYTQTYEVDYSEIFALQSNMDSIATIIALAAHYGWDLQQYDVKNAFLHGNLEEETYIKVSGFKDTFPKFQFADLQKFYMASNNLHRYDLGDSQRQ